MPRPVDDLRAQLAAEDPDFVAALLDDRVWPVEGFPAGDGKVLRGGGLVYHKQGQGVAVYSPPTHLRDGTEIDTDLTDGVTEDVAVTPFDGRLFRNGGYGLRVGGATVRFGGPEFRVAGNWQSLDVSRRTRQVDQVIWDDPRIGTYRVVLTPGGVDTRWLFVIPPPAIRVRLVVEGSIVQPDGTIPLPDGESFTIQPARWTDAADQSGVIPFRTQGGYIPLVLPAGLTYPVRIDG